ncbi:hypothetical protein SAY87_022073 [Trapa incisa]|nr:hypothetical protein SAY87_022073 [Trapa incisa]
MGNCCIRRSTVWAGDDWSGSEVSSVGDHAKRRGASNSVSPPCSGQRTVKIKMTKKELEKLLKEVDMDSMSLEQIITRLSVAAGDDFSFTNDCRRRPWRPALPSIPEVN